MNKEQKISFLSFIVLIGFIFSAFFHYALAYYFNIQLSTFLFDPKDHFNDFYNCYGKWYQYLPGEPSPYKCYFPFSYVIINFFRFFKPPIFSLLLFFSVFLFSFIVYAWKNIKTKDLFFSLQNTLIIVFLSFPTLFLLDRANFETFIFIFTALFLVFYQRKQYLICTIFLAMAIAMKLFPAIFLLLLISDKKYRESIYTVLMTGLFSIIPLFFFNGTVYQNVARMFENLNLFNQQYVIGDAGFNYSHSLFSLVKFLLKFAHLNTPVDLLAKYYVFVIFIFTIALCFYIIFVEKTFWKKVMLLVIAQSLFPLLSSDYKLVHFFIPLFLFFNAETSKGYKFFWWIYTFFLALLFIPKQFGILIHNSYYLGVFFDPILLIIIGILTVYSTFKLRKN